MISKINETVSYLKQSGIATPETGIILGTGLSKLVDEVKVTHRIDYEDIPNFPVSTVEFHKGELIYGKLLGKEILVMHGRFHLYEGYSFEEITFPIRVLKELNTKYLFVSNAGGAMNPDYKKGQLMLIDDHINLLPGSPLAGKYYPEMGPRFVDLSRPYSPFLNDKLKKMAKQNGITLHEGVYVAVTGPNLETRAEYRFLRNAGADVVGMSTVPEVIVANQIGLECCAISVLTDECDPDNLKPIDIDDIIASASKAEKDLIVLIRELLAVL